MRARAADPARRARERAFQAPPVAGERLRPQGRERGRGAVDAEHGHGARRQRELLGRQVEREGAHLGGIERRLQVLLAGAQRGACLLQIVEVSHRSEPAHLALRVAQGQRTQQEHAEHAACRTQAHAQLVRRGSALRREQRRIDLRQVVGMKRRAPAAAQAQRARQAGDLGPARIQVLHAALGARREEDVRHRRGHGLELFATGLQGALRGAPRLQFAIEPPGRDEVAFPREVQALEQEDDDHAAGAEQRDAHQFEEDAVVRGLRQQQRQRRAHQRERDGGEPGTRAAVSGRERDRQQVDQRRAATAGQGRDHALVDDIDDRDRDERDAVVKDGLEEGPLHLSAQRSGPGRRRSAAETDGTRAGRSAGKCARTNESRRHPDAVRMPARTAGALTLTPHQAHDERDQRDQQEQAEQDLRDRGGACSNTAESEHRCNDGNDEEHGCPVQHGFPP